MEERQGGDVMWEVGSVSDSEDGKDDKDDKDKDAKAPEEREQRGMGQQNGRGERRGLLGEDEDDDQPGPSRS